MNRVYLFALEAGLEAVVTVYPDGNAHLALRSVDQHPSRWGIPYSPQRIEGPWPLEEVQA